MEYALTGEFLEACDCTVICPCWVDDDPVEGHCTGFVLWEFDREENGKDSIIDRHVVTGCRVVSATIHTGNRRGTASAATSMVYIDVSGCTDSSATEDQLFQALSAAFAEHPTKRGGGTGPLAELAEMSGTVVGIEPAEISFAFDEDGHPDATERPWTVTVTRPHGRRDASKEAPAGELLIRATGQPQRFDVAEDAERKPLTLSHTALTYELQAGDPVTAQAGHELIVNVGALPGGSLHVTGRSGMRGTFRYHHAAPQKAAEGDGAPR